jgi:hypothetical protein
MYIHYILELRVVSFTNGKQKFKSDEKKKFFSGNKKISNKYKKTLLFNTDHDLHCSKVAYFDFDAVRALVFYKI